MWCRACIIIHNLIIWIEGNTVDEQWIEELLDCAAAAAGWEHGRAGHEVQDDDGDHADNLTLAQRRLLTPGKQFRLHLIDDLLNSGVSHH